MKRVTKQMRELMAKLREAEQNVRAAIAEENDELAEAAMNDVRKFRARIEALKEIEAAGVANDGGVPVGSDDPETRDERKLAQEYQRVFLKAIRRRPVSASEIGVIKEYRDRFVNVMHGGGVSGDADGDTSLVVPEDIQTSINGIMRQLNDLTQFIRQETVNTRSGSRVLEADEDMTPMAQVDEYGQIAETDNPKFTAVTYELKKRAGFLPLTNELLADTDQNILAYVSNWIARKVVVTRNTLITAQLDTLTKTALADFKALKKVLNVDLDPAISVSAVVLTNQDGFNWLDQLEDGQGRPLLQPDPTNATQRLLFGRRIAVVSNRYLPSVVDTSTLAPMIIGNLQQLLVHFWRGRFELASTREGGEAWRRDSTELRAITRDDVVKWDASAAVYGQVTIA